MFFFQIMRQLEVLRNRGIPLQPSEEAFVAKSETLECELNRPRPFKSRLNDFHAQLNALRAHHNLTRVNAYEVINEKAIEQIYQVGIIRLFIYFYFYFQLMSAK